jgi:hypothetical protein
MDVNIFEFPYDKKVEVGASSRQQLELGDEPGNGAMSKSKTAILWGPDDLLAQAMEFFLTAGELWEVIRIPVDRGTDCLIEQARKIKPEVIILHTEICTEDLSLPMQLIKAQPNLRVVITSLENNEMQVYSKHSVTLHQASDLLSVIEDRYFSENPTQKEVLKGRTEMI